MNNLKNLSKLALVALALIIAMGSCSQGTKKQSKKEDKVSPAKPGQHRHPFITPFQHPGPVLDPKSASKYTS